MQWHTSAVLAAATLILSSGCAKERVNGDRGCDAYGQARAMLPADADLLDAPAPVLVWINDTDARLTAVCQ
jgi:hypothetical protein